VSTRPLPLSPEPDGGRETPDPPLPELVPPPPLPPEELDEPPDAPPLPPEPPEPEDPELDPPPEVRGMAWAPATTGIASPRAATTDAAWRIDFTMAAAPEVRARDLL